MSDEILENIWKAARNELQDDYVGLWELVRKVRRRLPDLDDQQVQDAVLAMLDRGLRRREVRAGLGAAVGGLESVWSNPVDQVIEQIRHEWNELGRDPAPGEVVWIDKLRLDPSTEAEVVANSTKTYTQHNGAQVFVQQIGDRYNVVMQRERGRGTWHGISEGSLNQLARNLGWVQNRG